MTEALVIGAGFSGLSAACYLAKAGYQVTVLEKNDTPGGRARQLARNGFVFDMGPTWYWMPDIFERFFADFGKTPSDYYTLTRLNPSYQVYFSAEEHYTLSAHRDELLATFEKIEPGSSRFINDYLAKADRYYHAAVNDIIYRPGQSFRELITPETVLNLRSFTTSLSRHVRAHIKNDQLARILEFPVLFLGAQPADTPLFYALMNYADMVLGTWYVSGGMYQVVNAMVRLCRELGVKIKTSTPVDEILTNNHRTIGIRSLGKTIPADLIISTADYQHSETLLDASARNYPSRYWHRKVFAPSALLYYVGFSKKLERVSHHTLFFDTPFEPHARAIYKEPAWPDNPLFYGSFPSITDPDIAPDGKECGIFLIPVATGLEDDNRERREAYFETILQRMEKLTGQPLRASVEFCHSYGLSNFRNDYHAFQGNAYGMANTLKQTAFLRPSVENKKIRNLFYAGHLTVPGPGVPPALISGKIAAQTAIAKTSST